MLIKIKNPADKLKYHLKKFRHQDLRIQPKRKNQKQKNLLNQDETASRNNHCYAILKSCSAALKKP